MTREELRAFQRQDLTVVFANGSRETAPLSHWIGALLYSLDPKSLGKVVERVRAMDGKGPLIAAPDPAAAVLERIDHGRLQDAEVACDARKGKVQLSLHRESGARR